MVWSRGESQGALVGVRECGVEPGEEPGCTGGGQGMWCGAGGRARVHWWGVRECGVEPGGEPGCTGGG